MSQEREERFCFGKGLFLSETGKQFLGGLLEHARASTAFATPTINGYKRYRPYSLAPERVIWGRDNRGVMLRVLGGPGDPATRIENRIGEPAANPYLYFASQIHSGLDGMRAQADPGALPSTPLTKRKADHAASHAGGSDRMPEGEQGPARRAGRGVRGLLLPHQGSRDRARFNLEVSEWEHREYFDLL